MALTTKAVKIDDIIFIFPPGRLIGIQDVPLFFQVPHNTCSKVDSELSWVKEKYDNIYNGNEFSEGLFTYDLMARDTVTGFVNLL